MAVDRDERLRYPVGARVAMIVRPEDIRLRMEERAAGENVLPGTLVGREFLGPFERYRVAIGGQVLTLSMVSGDPGRPAPDREEAVAVEIDRRRIHLLGGRA